MVTPNKTFELNVQDIEQIESALFFYQTTLKTDKEKAQVIELRAKLHHQKVWYRPKDRYVSG